MDYEWVIVKIILQWPRGNKRSLQLDNLEQNMKNGVPNTCGHILNLPSITKLRLMCFIRWLETTKEWTVAMATSPIQTNNGGNKHAQPNPRGPQGL